MSMLRCQATRHALSRLCSCRSSAYHPATLPFSRPFSTTLAYRYARKDTQDKDSLKPRSTEYSKSGSDDAAASSDAAFNPHQTDPESELGTAEKESGGDSLNVSPGNKDVSKPRDSQEGGPSNSPKTGGSGGGGAPKAGGGKSG